MACFIVPATQAVVTAIVSKGIKKKEHNAAHKQTNSQGLPLSVKLSWLSKLLWGGSALLAFEHIWHGEIVPWFPFLTAAATPENTAEMLYEMSTVGVTMAVLVTLFWLGLTIIADLHLKKEPVSKVNPLKEV